MIWRVMLNRSLSELEYGESLTMEFIMKNTFELSTERKQVG